MASKARIKVLDHGSIEKKLLGYVRVMGDCTYSSIRKEIMQDGIVSESFEFVIEDEEDDEVCILNALQEERWQVENNKSVGIKRLSTMTDGGGPSKRACRSSNVAIEASDMNAREEGDERREEGDQRISNLEGGKVNMLKSVLVSKETLDLWELQCERTHKKLSERKPPRDDKFQLIMEDVNDQPLIRVWCDECGSAYGSGVIDGKQSAYSCLSNFMRFHILDGQAHKKRYLSNRGLKFDAFPTHGTRGSTTKENEDDCDDAVTILAAIEEMNKFNSTHEGADFQLVEATLHDYKDKQFVRVVCKYDGKWLHLCPRGSDLQIILTQHINAKSHIIAWSKTTPNQSSSLLTGASGRPRKHFEKDPRQQTLGAFLTSTKEHAEAASIPTGNTSSTLERGKDMG